MDAAGTGNSEVDAGAGGKVAVSGGGVASGLLVVEGEEADSEGDGAGGEGGYGDSDDAEHVFDAESG